ncbi:MAG: MBL fold metallo-hydrolase [Nocardioidaceae bacterium]
MRVAFVGSGDAFGSGGRAQTCISVTAAGRHLLVDCGATSLAAMKAQQIDPGSVDAVVVTHLHGDHFGGIPFLVLDGQFSRRTTPLTVYGPPGTRDRLTSAMEVLYPGSSDVDRRFSLDVHELTPDGSAVRRDGLTIRGWEVDHASGAPPLAVRLEAADKAFGYSGDTAWTPALASAAADTDAFAVEAYTYDKPVRYHLDYTTLRRHQAALATRRLILTHMSPSMLDRLDDAEHDAAYDGLAIEL